MIVATMSLLIYVGGEMLVYKLFLPFVFSTLRKVCTRPKAESVKDTHAYHIYDEDIRIQKHKLYDQKVLDIWSNTGWFVYRHQGLYPCMRILTT